MSIATGSERLLSRLRQLLAIRDIPPHRLALAIAVGLAVGVTPIVWGTSLLTLMLAWLLRLHQGAAQVANLASYPLQFALAYPFLILGRWLVPGSLLPTAAASDPTNVASIAATVQIQALAGWLILAPVLALIFTLVLTPLIRRHRLKESPSA